MRTMREVFIINHLTSGASHLISTWKKQKVANENFDWNAFENDLGVYDQPKEQIGEAYDKTLSNIAANEVTEGTVIGINKREVVVNIGYKSEGIIPISEFRYNPDLKVGDKIEVYVESAEDKNGQLALSHKKARQAQVVGSCERGPREGRNHQGLHQVPHQGRYDRRCIRHRGLPAGFADRREADPRLRCICR